MTEPAVTIRGNATVEEIAAVLAVLSALAAGCAPVATPDPDPAHRVPRYARRAARLRRAPAERGRRAWRTGLPSA